MSALAQSNRSSVDLPEYTLTMVESSRDSLYSDGSSTDHGLELCTAVDGKEQNAASYVLNTSTVETPSDTSESRTDIFDTEKHGVDPGTSSGEEGDCRMSNGCGEGVVSMEESMVFRDSQYYPEETENIPLIPLTNGQGSSQEVDSETELAARGLGGGCKVGGEQVPEGEGWLNGEHSSTSLVTHSSGSGGSSVWSEEDDVVHNERTSPQYGLLEDSADELSGGGSDHSSPVLTSFRRELSPLLEQDQPDKQGHPLDTGMEQNSNSLEAISASEEVAGDKEETAGLADSLQSPSLCQPTPSSPPTLSSPVTSAPSSPTSPCTSPPPRTTTPLTSPPLLSPSSPHKPQDLPPNEGESTSLTSPTQEEMVAGEGGSSINAVNADVEQIEEEIVVGKDGGKVEVSEAGGEREGTEKDGVKGEETREGQEGREEEAGREEEEGGEHLGEAHVDSQQEAICRQQGPEMVEEGEGAMETQEGVETQSRLEEGEEREPGDQKVVSTSEAPVEVSTVEEASPHLTTPVIHPPSPDGEEDQSPELPTTNTAAEREGRGEQTATTEGSSSYSLEDELAVDLLLESNLDSSNLDSGVRVSVAPSSNLPVLQPLSPDPDLNEQYEYLRRTLSHSRRRYSTRRRRTHGGGHSPSRRGNNQSLRGEGGQSRERQTVGRLRDMLHNDEAARGNFCLYIHMNYLTCYTVRALVCNIPPGTWG